tara:strand:+ start:16202 stop:17263 length:1062 start_codon:yes stop_codon:yes gene_type:complete
MDTSTSFADVLHEMIPDLLVSFPELADTLDKSLKSVMKDKGDADACEEVRVYCAKVVPGAFFDILYENEELFTRGDMDCMFLPGIDFSELWAENITDRTKATIWKYLQLILFSTIEALEDKASFGDAASLFNAISREEFEEKLEKTMDGMKTMFMEEGKGLSDSVPDATSIKEHVDKIMGGKLGSLAKEIADETLRDLNMDPKTNDPKAIEEVFASLFKNPQKLLGMVKTVGQKLDERVKNGEIKESEMLEEATEMMKDIKGIPGMSHLKDMLRKMGMNGVSKSQMSNAAGIMKQRTAAAKTRDRLRAKLAEKKSAMKNTELKMNPTSQPDGKAGNKKKRNKKKNRNKKQEGR